MFDTTAIQPNIRNLTLDTHHALRHILTDMLNYSKALDVEIADLTAVIDQINDAQKRTAHDLDVLTQGLKLWSAPTTKS